VLDGLAGNLAGGRAFGPRKSPAFRAGTGLKRAVEGPAAG